MSNEEKEYRLELETAYQKGFLHGAASMYEVFDASTDKAIQLLESIIDWELKGKMPPNLERFWRSATTTTADFSIPENFLERLSRHATPRHAARKPPPA